MHEFAIARSLIETAASEARRHDEARHPVVKVRTLRCRIGVFRQVDKTLLQESFEAARVGTVCEGARLEVEIIRPSLFCEKCGRRYEISHSSWQCPTCGADGGDLSGGDGLQLCSIDIETEDTGETPVPHRAACELPEDIRQTGALS